MLLFPLSDSEFNFYDILTIAIIGISLWIVFCIFIFINATIVKRFSPKTSKKILDYFNNFSAQRKPQSWEEIKKEGDLAYLLREGRCPKCREEIDRSATKCPHCTADI